MSRLYRHPIYTAVADTGLYGSREAITVHPGFGEGWLSFRRFTHELNRRTGRPTLFIDSPRWDGDDVTRNPGGAPTALQRLGLNAAAQMQAFELTGATGIFHSLAAITGSLAAELDPALFSTIVIVSGAGQLANERPGRLLRAVGRKSWHCLRDGLRQVHLPVGRANLASLLDGARYMITNPVRSAAEAWGAGNYYVRPLIRRLMDEGVTVYFVVARQDVVYDHDGAVTALREYVPPSHIISLDGVHDLQLEPERLVDALIAHGLLSAAP